MEKREKEEESLMQKYSKVLLVVALYWVISISMVFLNKTLLGGSDSTSKDAPIFVTWFQCVVTVALCFILSKVSRFLPGVVSFPDVGAMDKEIAMKVLPLTVMFVCMITFNNLCLKYVGVSFYYVGRSLSTVFNVIFSFLILNQRTSCSAILCCMVIIGGFALGVDQEGVAGSLSIKGVVFGVLAASFVALNSIYTKKVLPAVNDSVWLLSYYNNALACVVFVPIIVLYGELSSIATIVKTAPMSYWGLMVITGVCGFAIGYVTGLQIKVTSPLTHMISGTAKACAQTVIATSWYNEVKPGLWWLSNAIVLLGSVGYTRVKQLQMKDDHNKNAQLDESKKPLSTVTVS